MDTENHTPEETHKKNENPLTVTESVPCTSTVEPVATVEPFAAQSELPAESVEQQSAEEDRPVPQPIAVRIIKDVELSTFERKTIRYGAVGILVAFLALVAACITAYWIYEQFQAIEEANEVAGFSANKARYEARASDEAVAKQLIVIQRQLTEARRSANAATLTSNAARLSAETAQKQLELSDRPWVGVQGPINITGPIHTNPSGVNFIFDLVNLGKSAALGVTSAIWVSGGVTDGFKLMSSDHCQQMVNSEKQFIRGGGYQPEKLGTSNVAGSIILPGGVQHVQLPPQQDPLPQPATNVYALSCIVYFDELDIVHLTQTTYCFLARISFLIHHSETSERDNRQCL